MFSENLCGNESTESHTGKEDGCPGEEGDNELNPECCSADDEDEEAGKPVFEETESLDPEGETKEPGSFLGTIYLICRTSDAWLKETMFD